MSQWWSKVLRYLVQLGRRRKVAREHSWAALYNMYDKARAGVIFFEGHPAEWQQARAYCTQRYKRPFRPTEYEKVVSYLIVDPTVDGDYKATSRYTCVLKCLRAENVPAGKVAARLQDGGITKLLAAHGRFKEDEAAQPDDEAEDGSSETDKSSLADHDGFGPDSDELPGITACNGKEVAGNSAPGQPTRLSTSVGEPNARVGIRAANVSGRASVRARGRHRFNRNEHALFKARPALTQRLRALQGRTVNVTAVIGLEEADGWVEFEMLDVTPDDEAD